jgi:hypothetical protein
MLIGLAWWKKKAPVITKGVATSAIAPVAAGSWIDKVVIEPSPL